RDGVAVQVIEPGSAVTLELERIETEEQVERICRAERGYCFAVTGERLCRIRVLRVMKAEETERGHEAVEEALEDASERALEESFEGALEGASEYVVLVTLHHSVSDGWSLGVLFSELSQVYGALSRGKPSPLAPL